MEWGCLIIVGKQASDRGIPIAFLYQSYHLLTEGAVRLLLTRAGGFGLTAMIAGSALSAPPSMARAFFAGLDINRRSRNDSDGRLSVYYKDDDADKDDNQNTKKQHSIKCCVFVFWGHTASLWAICEFVSSLIKRRGCVKHMIAVSVLGPLTA